MSGVCNDCHNHPCVCGMEEAGSESSDLLGDFYDWLRTQFTDLESAKTWGRKWFNEMDQKTPFGECTARAMAYHINQALEGRMYCDETGAFTIYSQTKHGSEIVNAIWGGC